MPNNLLKQLIGNFVNEAMAKRKKPSFVKPKGMLALRESLNRLNEAAIDDMKRKFPNVADRIDFFRDVPPKYIQWIAKSLASTSGPESDEDLKDAIMKFDMLVRKNKTSTKDINAYDPKKYLDFIQQMEELSDTAAPSRKDQKKNATMIYRDGRYVVLQPHDMAASCQYGFGTKWCISAREENMFDQYQRDGAEFVFVIDKTPSSPEYAKVAFAYTPENRSAIEIYDATDARMSVSVFASLYPPAIYEALKPYVNIAEINAAFQQKVQDAVNGDDKTLRRQLANLWDRNIDIYDVGVYSEIIAALPLERLHIPFFPLGNTSFTLRNAGADDVYNAELLKRNLTVDQFLQLVSTIYKYWRITAKDSEDGSSYSLYDYIDKRSNWTMEELQKLGSFNPYQGFTEEELKIAAAYDSGYDNRNLSNFHLFSHTVHDILAKKKLEELGVPTLKPMVYWLKVNSGFKNDIMKILRAKRANPAFDIASEWEARYADDWGGEADGQSVAKLIQLWVEGQLSDLLPPPTQ